MNFTGARRGHGSGERGGIIFKTILLVGALAVLLAVFLLRAPILRTTGGWLVVEDTLQPSDAIVVLGDDNYESSRAARGAGLFAERWAPKVVASGRYLRAYATTSELIRKDLMNRGVPQASIIVLAAQTSNTREEAIAVRELMRRNRWRRIIVVTSNYHTRRARFTYRRVLDPADEVRVAPAADPAFDPQRWWQQRSGLKAAFNEVVGLVVAWWETRGPQTAPQPASPP